VRCIAWPRVAIAALAVGLLTGVALPLALHGATVSVQGAVVDVAQVTGAVVASFLVSSRQRWLHAWVTFFACVFVAGAFAAAVGALA
jgi:hypothetical protein